MRLSDLLEAKKNKRKKGSGDSESPAPVKFTIEITKQYKKAKDSLGSSDPVLKKSVLRFETLLAKHGRRTPQEEEEFKSFKPHAIKYVGSKKGKSLLDPHKKAGFNIFQAHLSSTQKKGRFVVAYGTNTKSKTIRLILVGTHDQTTGG